ncbi:MAG: PD40 domain-containing protein, partial [Chloroflexi bacterium]|nr:PD40 domain-containing protein [Chloroflexota bacterium]
DEALLTVSEAPYQGLQYFDEEAAERFFGREALTARLVAHLCANQFLAVVGASGSGKSSLLRAGLVPALRRGLPLADGTLPPPGSDCWQILVITPTAHPLEALANGLTRGSESVAATATLMDDLARDPRSLHLAARRLLAGRPRPAPDEREAGREARLLLVVDQLEELFTLCRDEAERNAFVDNLLPATAPETGGPTLVVAALRADFYAHCGYRPALRERVARQQEYIGPMNAEELRRAIEGPAARGGWELEAGLADLLLQDAGDEPGALPLMSYALLETWRRRRWHVLTLKAYNDSGGVRGALARSTERVLEQMTPPQQAIARSIFLRLTELGEGAPDTRRRVARQEFFLRPAEAPMTEAVLSILADARLITTSADAVEVAHEALIREWPRLRDWLAEDREELRTHRHLTEAAQEWAKLNRDAGALYRGARLARAAEWDALHHDELNPLEREFLAASRELAEREEAEREAQRQRELQAARKLAATERRRAEEQGRARDQLRRRAIVLSVALVAVALLGVAALSKSQQAAREAQRSAALVITAQVANTQAEAEKGSAQVASTQAVAQEATAQAASTQAVAEGQNRATQESIALASLRHAQAQRLAAEANGLLQVGGNSELIALLTLRSLNVEFTLQGDAMLLRAVNLAYPRQVLPTNIGLILSAAVSPDGRTVLFGGADGTARLWDVRAGEQLRAFEGHSDAVNGVAFAPDGKTILTGSSDGAARLWDVSDGTELRALAAGRGAVLSVGFSPDGKTVLTGQQDGSVWQWEASSGQVVREFNGHSGAVLCLALPADGKTLLTGGEDTTARLWDVATGRELQTLRGHTDRVQAVALSSDGRYAATASYDGTARVWEALTGAGVQAFIGHENGVLAAAFSPDDRYLITASYDKTARLWDIQTGDSLRIFTHPSSVRGLAWSPDGKTIFTSDFDGTVRLWDVWPEPYTPRFLGHTGPVSSAVISPDGSQVLTGSFDKTARLWDARTGVELREFSGHTDVVNSVAFSPDGQTVLTGSWDGTVRMWETRTGAEVRQFAHPKGALSVAFSPDGRYVLSGGWDNMAYLWDARTGEQLHQFAGHGGVVISVAFSPDGQTALTSGGDDHTLRLWDTSTGELIHALAAPNVVNSAVFSPDGRYILGGLFDDTARLWEAGTGEAVRTFTGHTDFLFSVAYAPDGQTILTGGADGTARLWDAATGKELRRFGGHTAAINSTAFSPDGRFALTASD